VIAAKAVAFGEALTPEFISYQQQVKSNATALANALTALDYKIISGGTDNHLMLIDLRNKNISGKQAENMLVKADITANKNMVPFDDKSPFVTSGIRLGTPAVTSRGLKEKDMQQIATWIDTLVKNVDKEEVAAKVKSEVNEYMHQFPLYK
jgi:glycine hydroxymethyltransferase